MVREVAWRAARCGEAWRAVVCTCPMSFITPLSVPPVIIHVLPERAARISPRSKTTCKFCGSLKFCAPPVTEMRTDGTPAPQSCTSQRATTSAAS